MHQLHVPGMKCGGCLGAVTRAIHSIDPKATIEADMEARQLRVTSRKDSGSLRAVLEAAGYPAQSQNNP